MNYFAFFLFKEIEGKILNRYAHRLLKLKVKFAEISIVVRPAPKVDPGVYRYIVIEKFREITQNLLIFTFDK